MKVVKEKAIKELLGLLDPAQRKMVTEIFDRKVRKVVKCMSKKCKGRTIALIYLDRQGGEHIAASGEVGNKKDPMRLLAYRKRLDGKYGFQCSCGNDSRLCEAEMGVSGIENGNPTAKDIEQVAQNLQTKKSKKDKFLIEKI